MALRHIKREKPTLPVDVRRSKTSLRRHCLNSLKCTLGAETPIRAFSLTWPALCKLEQKKELTQEKSLTPTGLVWDTNMATVSLFRNINMAAVTSCETLYCLLEWGEGKRRRLFLNRVRNWSHQSEHLLKWCNTTKIKQSQRRSVIEGTHLYLFTFFAERGGCCNSGSFFGLNGG